MNYNESVNELLSVFKKHFNSRHYSVELVNFNKVIKVESKHNNPDRTYIWIRLMPTKSGIQLDVSSINLSTSTRRKGKLTNLVKDLIETNIISSLTVTGACTDAMKNWCVSRGFTYIGDGNYKLIKNFILPKRH